MILVPAAAIAFHPLHNNDLPMHLAIGEWILQNGEVPDYDPFSGGVDRAPWVPHEWLAGVAAALIERAAGGWGLVLAAVIGSALIAFFHAQVMVRIGATLPGLLIWCLPVWLMAGRRLMLRPHILALGLIFLLWWILLDARRRPRLLFLVPLVMVLWVNVHGSYYLGLAIVCCGLLLDGFDHAASIRQRLLIFGLSVVALLVQPYGLDGLLHPLRLTGSEVFMQQIQEWAPPLGSTDHSSLFRTTPAFALSVLFACAIVPGLARKSVPLPYGLFLLASLLLYLRHQRYLALFALAALPYAPLVALQLRQSASAWLVRALPVAGAVFVLAVGYPVTWQLFRPPVRSGGLDLWGAQMPFWEVEQLAHYGYHGRVLCEYDYGGVVAWKSDAELKPSMDSRNSVYGPERFLTHQDLLSGSTADYERVVAEYLDDTVAVIIASPWLRDRARLHEVLSAPEWLLVSYNHFYFCYVRANAAPPNPLAKAAIRVVRPDTGWIQLMNIDELPRALVEAEYGIQQQPRPITALAIYGQAHVLAARAGKGMRAKQSLENAKRAAALLRQRTDRRPSDNEQLQQLLLEISKTVVTE